jgi:DnaK suppressor protein
MSSLTRDQIAQLAEALKRERQAISNIVGDELSHSFERSFRGIAGGVTDSGDAAAADAMADLDAAQTDRQVNHLRDIDTALQRLREGTYGECIECSAAIGFERLEAYPAATRCIECQGRHEHQYAHPGTPRL